MKIVLLNLRRHWVLLFVMILFATAAASQQVSSDQLLSFERLTLDRQAFEKAADYFQKIVDSVLLIFGGSIAVLFGTGYQRPANKWMRLIYLLFPMGWAALGFSIWNGMRVRGTYIAYLLGQPEDVTQRTDRIEQLNGFALSQEKWLYFGLAIFAVWLLIYLIW